MAALGFEVKTTDATNATSLLETAQGARREALPALLNEATVAPTPFPIPVVNMIADYADVLTWKLQPSCPAVQGRIERFSDFSAGIDQQLAYAFIQGDTPLSSGLHAWRVTVYGMGEYGYESAFGVAAYEPGRPPLRTSREPGLYGIFTSSTGFRVAAGELSQDSGFERIRSGDTLDFLLDASGGTLTVFTLKDGRRCEIALPRGRPAWLPHFCLNWPQNAFRFEVLAPEQAGKRDAET